MSQLRKYIRNLRRDFISGVLDKKSVSKSPFVQFESWMKQAIDAGIEEPNAMTLSTVDKNLQPDSRVVLLRDLNRNGFSFFTNYLSEKGKQIQSNKRACLNFYWPELHRQVRIKGMISRLSPKESDEYFDSRPRESQIGAWASQQSSVLESRASLESKIEFYLQKFEGMKVPRPIHWGGYRLNPKSMEFWQGRENRLHDRILYTKMKNGAWKLNRLNP
ncbi:MAG: pyridoxamine 5'-phosphate oxidase [Bacteroidetes bacterium]|nr:MAG: pyridoxamine 5'-phosphate oxidase [Bacteroidota bacterium]REK08151.1 MAG: pyridoxamine 5'-phosphate oxidase [Bacteroidota bacterium]REK32356.1 MAG: pyridoxamine 5'-phosphate oxidase [Bacteroidota bacterium]REK49590.1 MAG: pyridoxamine 5'-phosphate oxidase [Bacteroidota bacterium]